MKHKTNENKVNGDDSFTDACPLARIHEEVIRRMSSEQHMKTLLAKVPELEMKVIKVIAGFEKNRSPEKREISKENKKDSEGDPRSSENPDTNWKDSINARIIAKWSEFISLLEKFCLASPCAAGMPLVSHYLIYERFKHINRSGKISTEKSLLQINVRRLFEKAMILRYHKRRKTMTATAKKLEQQLAQDKCGDHSIGRKVYAYLEGKLSDEEAEKFVAHVESCTACLETIVRWHYESVVSEIDSKNQAEDNVEEAGWAWHPGGAARSSENASGSNNQKSRTKIYH